MSQTTKRVPAPERQTYFDRFTKLYLRDNTPELVDVEVLRAA